MRSLGVAQGTVLPSSLPPPSPPPSPPAAAAALPDIGASVCVLFDDAWLDGIVIENNELSGAQQCSRGGDPSRSPCRTPDNPFARMSHAGEFLVDFDDASEGEAWISIAQQWRRIGPAFEADAAAVEEDTPAVPPSADAQPATIPADAAPPVPSKSPQVAPEPEEWAQLVRTEFTQLLATTMLTDGYADESADATYARFRRLHEQVAEADPSLDAS
jgi:hypothetical protein